MSRIGARLQKARRRARVDAFLAEAEARGLLELERPEPEPIAEPPRPPARVRPFYIVTFALIVTWFRRLLGLP